MLLFYSHINTYKSLFYACNACSYIHAYKYNNYYTYILKIQVPLAIQLKDENKIADMVDIMSSTHKYVPMVETEKEETPLQLRELTLFNLLVITARARGAQMARVNSTTPSGKLAGLVPAVADWHIKDYFYGV